MSTTLQLGLAIGGGLLLAAVVAYNTWSASKNAPKQPDPSPPSTLQGDEEGERRDPAFDGYHGEELPPLPTPERKPGMDALIDVLSPIALEHAVSGDTALAGGHGQRAQQGQAGGQGTDSGAEGGADRGRVQMHGVGSRASESGVT